MDQVSILHMKSQGKQSQKIDIIQIKIENKGPLISLKQELFMWVSGREDLEMGMESKHGQMGLNM